MNALIPGIALVIYAVAIAQPVQPPAPQGTATQSSAVPREAPRPTSSNRWESLPEMSKDHCLAEAIGTASDAETGAPVHAALDPQTGKPLCASEQKGADTRLQKE